jgi:hypothetical protein
VDDEGRWVDAEDLEVGDLLLLADGTTTEVDGVWHHTQTLTVHNLTVEGIHTYHVALGDQQALVHNCALGGAATGELPAARRIDASWGPQRQYREGPGPMSALEHVMYRHGHDSGFVGVSRFSEGTGPREIKGLVDEALRSGTLDEGGEVPYDAGRTIGSDLEGNATSRLQVWVQDGHIQTAYPT